MCETGDGATGCSGMHVKRNCLFQNLHLRMNDRLFCSKTNDEKKR